MNVLRARRFLVSVAASMILSGALSGIAMAQYGPPPGQQQQWQHDDDHWGRGPEGYSDYYHEQDRPNYGARRGYEAGFRMGISDREHGHSYRPTHLDEFKHIPDAPHGVNRDEFKYAYREAFLKAYQRAYGR